MFQNFTAKIRNWAGLPFEDVHNILKWMDSNKSKVDFNNPNLLIGSACDRNGRPLTYITIESLLLVSDYALRPALTDEDAGNAGSAIDSAIVREAQQRGVGKVLIVLPDEAPPQRGERQIRFLERKIQNVTTQEVNYLRNNVC